MYRYPLILILLAFMTAGCSAYHPFRNGEGYTEIPVGPNNYQVTFAGGSTLTLTETRQNCLTRAAELAILHDDPYFRIVDEHIYISYGTTYIPGSYEPGYAYVDRRGYVRGYRAGWYDPGYTEVYSVPEVTMRIALERQPGENSIPAAYLIDDAINRGIKFHDDMVQRAETMPRTGAPIPPPPTPTTRPVGSYAPAG